MDDETNIMPSDSELKQEPLSPVSTNEPQTTVVNLNNVHNQTTPKTNNFIINSLNGNNQVVVTAGNKMVPIRGILLKPVHSGGTTTLISVPVSMTSNGTNVQTVSSTNAVVAEKEKPITEKVMMNPVQSRGVSKVNINLYIIFVCCC